MTYSVGQVRNWELGALIEAGDAVAGRASVAQDARSILSDGGEVLDEGWDGLAADAVLDAVEFEKAHVTKLADAALGSGRWSGPTWARRPATQCMNSFLDG